MAKNKLILKKQRSLTAKKLTEARARARQLRVDEDALAQQLEAVQDEIPADLEQQLQTITDAQTETDDLIGELVDTLQGLDDALAQLEDAPPAEEPPMDDPSEARSAPRPASRRSVPAAPNFRCRSRCFTSRSARDAFYGNTAVKDFLQRVRSIPGTSRRAVTGAQLTIPTVMLDLLRDNLDQYSKLLPHVRLRPVSGEARQNIVGKVPEGVWMEMNGVLNDLEFRITDVETDGYKVGGFIPIDNYMLRDSDIALGEEIMYMLSQSIGYALDKGIVFGLGPNSHMPVGIITRLAQTSKPGYWGDNQGDWTDLHSSNLLKLDLATKSGTDFFIPFLGALSKAKPTYTTDGKIWIMNDTTRQDILIRSLAYNANAALMAGFDNTMPVVGGEIITLEFLPDYMVAGGYGGEYLLVERDGGTFGSSDAPLYIQDKTVFKGTARYDGQPVSGEAFVGVSYNNTDVMTKIDFTADYANTNPNSLIVTSAASTSGNTILTVAGAVSSANTLKAFVGAPVSIGMGEEPGDSWLAIVSGSTKVKASTGSGVTVVELDAKGKVISIGYCASVTAGA